MAFKHWFKRIIGNGHDNSELVDTQKYTSVINDLMLKKRKKNDDFIYPNDIHR